MARGRKTVKEPERETERERGRERENSWAGGKELTMNTIPRSCREETVRQPFSLQKEEACLNVCRVAACLGIPAPLQPGAAGHPAASARPVPPERAHGGSGALPSGTSPGPSTCTGRSQETQVHLLKGNPCSVVIFERCRGGLIPLAGSLLSVILVALWRNWDTVGPSHLTPEKPVPIHGFPEASRSVS